MGFSKVSALAITKGDRRLTESMKAVLEEEFYGEEGTQANHAHSSNHD